MSNLQRYCYAVIASDGLFIDQNSADTTKKTLRRHILLHFFQLSLPFAKPFYRRISLFLYLQR